MSSIIIPNLFIGSIEDRQDTATLRSHDIRLIVCCCHSGRASLFSFIPTGGNTKEVFQTQTEFEDAIRRSDDGGIFLLDLPMDDTTTFDIFSFFPMTSSVIRTAREEKKWAVFVHCIAGVSRSASVVAAYLLQAGLLEGNSHTDCVTFLKSKRPCVNPNAGFMSQLFKWSLVCRTLMADPSANIADALSVCLAKMGAVDRESALIAVVRGMLLRRDTAFDISRMVRGCGTDPKVFGENVVHLMCGMVEDQLYADVPNLWGNWADLVRRLDSGSILLDGSEVHTHVAAAVFACDFEDDFVGVLGSFGGCVEGGVRDLVAVVAARGLSPEAAAPLAQFSGSAWGAAVAGDLSLAKTPQDAAAALHAMLSWGRRAGTLTTVPTHELIEHVRSLDACLGTHHSENLEIL